MSKYYMFTCNNYTDEKVDMISSFALERAEYLVYQKETGNNGTKHLQGYMCLKKMMMKSTVILRLSGCHIEKRLGNHSQAKTYCMKEQTRDNDTLPVEFGSDELIPTGKGQRTDLKEIQKKLKVEKYSDVLEQHFGTFAKYPRFFKEYSQNWKRTQFMFKRKSELEKKELRVWQKQVLRKLDAQNDRKVLWVWESEGNTGKSWLADYLQIVKGAYLCQLGKKTDIAYAYDLEKIVVFDLTRSDKDFTNYSTIEAFKNGKLFSPKYESKMLVFPPCKVVVFANYSPDFEKLSEDRWEIITPSITRVVIDKPRARKRKVIDITSAYDEEDDFIADSDDSEIEGEANYNEWLINKHKKRK